jgi:Raf kinase inhibitor-like YbhB/YbcL family protein
MELKSPAFQDGEAIPPIHTCDGGDVSPPLEWSGAPPGTRSLALIMEDPDAPVGTWVHWVLYDLPAGLKGLGARLPKTECLADGAKHGLCWGTDRFSKVGYHGPCPPPGPAHRYVFTLYALDAAPRLPPRRTKTELLQAMKGRVLAQAALIGLYGRRGK